MSPSNTVKAPAQLGLALLGCCATLIPWVAGAAGLTEASVHSDLWLSLPIFTLLVVIARRRVPARWLTILVGALACVVAAANLERVWGNAFSEGEGPAGLLLRGYARGHLTCYVTVALMGVALILLGLARPSIQQDRS